jgi:hypothetical protein
MPRGTSLIGKDFRGHAQYHSSWYTLEDREFVRSLYRPTWKVRRRMAPAVDAMADHDGNWVGIHLRRGDYGQAIFYITPVAWYLRELDKLWPRLNNPRMFIATESPELVQEFAKYEPVTAEGLGINLASEPLENYEYLQDDLVSREPLQMDFFPDWYLLSHCDVILCGNSTYAVTAAMMNPNAILYRSHLPTQRFERIGPWASWPIQRDHINDYPHVEGIRREDQ